MGTALHNMEDTPHNMEDTLYNMGLTDGYPQHGYPPPGGYPQHGYPFAGYRPAGYPPSGYPGPLALHHSWHGGPGMGTILAGGAATAAAVYGAHHLTHGHGSYGHGDYGQVQAWEVWQSMEAWECIDVCNSPCPVDTICWYGRVDTSIFHIPSESENKYCLLK
ncbi:hypothetical protein Tco_1295313 [Tanacetum coccineum]